MSKVVTVLYFASLRELLGLDKESIPLSDDITDIAMLMSLLRQRGNHWENAFSGNQQLMASINQQMAKPAAMIAAGDEIAFFPPVTGG